MAPRTKTKQQASDVDRSDVDTALIVIERDLYAAPRVEFIAARGARVKELRADGDRELAARVAKLAKPSAVAAAVNAAVRAKPKVARDLVATVAKMQSAGSARASADRHDELVRQLVDAARSELRAAGEQTSATRMADVAAAIRSAALADDSDAFVEGRLAREAASGDDTLEAALRAGMAGAPARMRAPAKEAGRAEPEGDTVHAEPEADDGTEEDARALAEQRAERRRLKAALAEAKSAARASSAELREAEREVHRAERALENARAARDTSAEVNEHAEQLAAELVEELAALD